MKVGELRKLLPKYTKENLIALIIEMYKATPKSVREDKRFDSMIGDIETFMSERKSSGRIQKGNTVEVADLQYEIEQFIDYAYKQYYFAPNSYVHKKDRPKWRFEVKRYIKDLQSVPEEGKDGELGTKLLRKLYEMLCYACCYYIFNTNDPFRSVGVGQEEIVDSIISRTLSAGVNEKSIRSLIELVVLNGLDSELLHSDLFMILIKNLKTADMKGIAVEQCKILKDQLEKADAAKKSRSKSTYDYFYEQKTNNLVELVFRINVELCEFDNAIRYFADNYESIKKEIGLYVLLGLLFEYDLKDYWKREYERAISNGIKPRDRLKNVYDYIIENDDLPGYM